MICLKNLCKRFDDTEIYKDVNYKFKENKLTCFFGPSGSGKTTLLNLIAGFDTDYEGEIIVDEVKLNELSMDKLCEYRFQNIGFIFQNYNLLKGYTALENILMGIHLNENFTEGEKTKRAMDLLTSLGLEEKINQTVETLSGGQKQRVAIARALVNNPKIILADEPTGALDSEATKAIMDILKEISKERTVIIITHDEDVVEYADEIIELEDYKIAIKRSAKDNEEVAVTTDNEIKKNGTAKLDNKVSTTLSIKNFKIHFFKFIIAGLIIAFGSAAFMGALSSKKITNNIIEDFKTKNFFYNIGQSPIDDKLEKDVEEVFDEIKSREDVENVYYQYDLENITLKNDDKKLDIEYKVPTIIAKESLAYGNMPREGENEIAISSNVANRLVNDVKSILGKDITLEYVDNKGNNESITLKVCGLSNSPYQDFIVSTDIEKLIYDKINKGNPSAISFDIKNFEEISKIDKAIREAGIGVYTKAEEVSSFQNSFLKLMKLYNGLSYIILIVGVIISTIILYKVSIERYTEVGLLGALGYKMININSIMFKESVYFATLSTIISCMFIFVLEFIYKMQFGYGLELNLLSFIILIGINIILTMGLSNLINIKLIKTEPAKALRR
ncbi:Lipoprotein-releasing system ATP-binding protein LolD [uncultured Clostridium sp.]|uniref:ABC transporter ATP-binding protein/permease n=1 Tax=uncultured Clostridium sp. TaxID=59620 RepID=UPI0008219126|nr:ABC transporter ATP-binding protein/permease [uncultured Clostridium sp.]SCJ11132.1 Lipoprotein-releasing system ATP-binding protein LolD [uncultured Clostridium sp.]